MSSGTRLDPNVRYLRGHELGCAGCFDCRYCGDPACQHWAGPQSWAKRFGCRKPLDVDGSECDCRQLDPEEPEFITEVSR